MKFQCSNWVPSNVSYKKHILLVTNVLQFLKTMHKQSKNWSGVQYPLKCKDCDSLYIGKSGRKLEKRPAEHKSKAASSKSAIREHVERSKGHNIDWENVKVFKREPKDFPRKILEAIHIRTVNPKLNRDKGLELDPVWDNLLATKDTRGPRGNSSLTSPTSMTSDKVVHHYNITAITTAEDVGRPGESAPVSVIFCSVEVQT